MIKPEYSSNIQVNTSAYYSNNIHSIQQEQHDFSSQPSQYLQTSSMLDLYTNNLNNCHPFDNIHNGNEFNTISNSTNSTNNNNNNNNNNQYQYTTTMNTELESMKIHKMIPLQLDQHPSSTNIEYATLTNVNFTYPTTLISSKVQYNDKNTTTILRGKNDTFESELQNSNEFMNQTKYNETNFDSINNNNNINGLQKLDYNSSNSIQININSPMKLNLSYIGQSTTVTNNDDFTKKNSFNSSMPTSPKLLAPTIVNSFDAYKSSDLKKVYSHNDLDKIEKISFNEILPKKNMETNKKKNKKKVNNETNEKNIGHFTNYPLNYNSCSDLEHETKGNNQNIQKFGSQDNIDRNNFTTNEQKDDKYWVRRLKNNLAAKRSRDARRMKENQIIIRATFFENENDLIRKEIEDIKQEIKMLKVKLSQQDIK